MKTAHVADPSEKLAYNVGELGTVLGIGYPAANNLCHIQGFPALKVGNRYIIPKESLEKWLVENAGRNNA